MTAAEWLAVVAVILGAFAVLPGSLGVLALTNNIAAGTRGARFIYGRSGLLLWASLWVIGPAIYVAISCGASALFAAAVAAYAGILVFGFVMHTKRMFRPVRQPTFVSVDAAIERFGPGEEAIGVIDKDGTPFAFVTRLARRPHIVHQPDGSAPFVMTHCILSHSSMAYAAEGDFNRPEFSVAAALANNLVIYDQKNACAISQIQNQGRDGRLVMDTLPTVTTTLKAWKALYPNSRVWARSATWRDAFFLSVLSRADVINPLSDYLIYPLQRPRDDRLPLKSQVIGVRIGKHAKAYPLSLFEQQRTVNDTVGGQPILVASAFDGDYIQVFDRQLDGAVLTFKPASREDGFVDEGTGSIFTPDGRCVSGKYEGRCLRPVPHYNKIFWFPWADYFPATQVYSDAPEARSA